MYGPNGDVRMCPWAVAQGCYTVGNLKEQSLEQIWQSDRAKMFRKSLIDKTYCFCEVEKCPVLANNSMDECSIEIDTDIEPLYPTELSLAYEWDCNYRCTCCRTHYYKKTEEEKLWVSKIEDEIRKALPYVKILSANGMGELFASPSILNILSQYEPKDNQDEIIIVLESNGSLFDGLHWEKIKNLGNYQLNVHLTIMSFEENVFQFLSGTSLPINKIEESLRFVKSLRENGTINWLELATVVQERNFWYLPEFTRRCLEEFGADSVRIRPFFPYFGSSAGEYDTTPEAQWFFDVRNPHHPYYKEYKKIMCDPIFEHPKVFKWSGNMDSELGTVDHYIRNFRPLDGECCEDFAHQDEEIACLKHDNIQLIEDNKAIIERYNTIFEDYEKTVNLCNETWGNYEAMKNSVSFKIGRCITAIPRKIRDMEKNE